MENIKKIWWFSLAFKLVLSALIPLFNDEAYYWVWSHHLQLSFYDHPPMIAWLFRLGHFFEPFGHAVRWPIVFMGHLTLLIWIKILQPHFSEKQLLWFTLLFLLMPLCGPGSLVGTPDIPLMFFWSLSLLTFLNILNRPCLSTALTLGAALGLGFTSKYHTVLFFPSALLGLWLSGQLFKFSAKLWLTVFLGFALGSSPVVFWNLKNNFISFQFQLEHGLGATAWSPSWTMSYLLGQFFLIFPTIFFTAVKTRWTSSFLQVLAPMSWFPLLFFFFTSFKGQVEANWPIVAHPGLLALAVLSAKNMLSLKVAAVTWLGAFTLLIAVIFLPNNTRLTQKTKLFELYKYKNLSQVIHNYQPLYAENFQMAAQLSYLTKKNIYKVKGMSRIDFYDFQEKSTPKTTTFFVAASLGNTLPKMYLDAGHKIVQRIPVDENFEVLKVTVNE